MNRGTEYKQLLLNWHDFFNRPLIAVVKLAISKGATHKEVSQAIGTSEQRVTQLIKK